MSEEHLRIVRGAFEAWNREDLDWFDGRVAPEYELRPYPGFLDLDEIYHGLEGFKRFWGTWRDAWDDIAVTVSRIESFGDEEVLALTTFDGRGRGSGAETSLEVGTIFKFRGEMILRFDALPSWAEALEAAGLPD